MEIAKSMMDRSMGDSSGGSGPGHPRQEQQAAIMQLYRLTAEVKVEQVHALEEATHTTLFT